jgi:hypothetical protein
VDLRCLGSGIAGSNPAQGMVFSRLSVQAKALLRATYQPKKAICEVPKLVQGFIRNSRLGKATKPNLQLMIIYHHYHSNTDALTKEYIT